MSQDITYIEKQVLSAWYNLQQQNPLTQCITNQVASNYAANVLLACGASPAMIDNPFEAESFTKISQALSINLGTPTSEQVQAMHISAKTAHQHHVPWVLDPVGYSDVLPWRRDITNELLQFKPNVIRGNASEINTLAGQYTESKGVDSTLNSQEVYQHAHVLLKDTHCVAISGPSDFVLAHDLHGIVQINGGSLLQTKVTASGCALGALIAAYCAVAPISIATIAAHVHFAIAGKLAHQTTQSIGQFNVTFLDELHSMTSEKMKNHIDIEYV